MSFWKKPDGPHVTAIDNPIDNPLTTTVYPGQGQYSISVGGAGGGGPHSPAQLGGSKFSTSIYSNNAITSGVFAPTQFDVTDHIIQGQMLVAEYSYDYHEAQFMDDDHIKRILVKELVEQMFHCKHIEFTKQTVFESNSLKARARIYVTPDSNVKIIREWQKVQK